jgi:hypothetical protein
MRLTGANTQKMSKLRLQHYKIRGFNERNSDIFLVAKFINNYLLMHYYKDLLYPFFLPKAYLGANRYR